MKLCAKNPSHSGDIKNFPALASQRFKNIFWGMYNFQRKRLDFFLDFLNCSSALYHKLYRIQEKKNSI